MEQRTGIGATRKDTYRGNSFESVISFVWIGVLSILWKGAPCSLCTYIHMYEMRESYVKFLVTPTRVFLGYCSNSWIPVILMEQLNDMRCNCNGEEQVFFNHLYSSSEIYSWTKKFVHLKPQSDLKLCRKLLIYYESSASIVPRNCRNRQRCDFESIFMPFRRSTSNACNFWRNQHKKKELKLFFYSFNFFFETLSRSFLGLMAEVWRKGFFCHFLKK